MKKKTSCKACKVCGKDFIPRNSLVKVCSVPCAIEFARKESITKAAKDARKKKKEFYDNDIPTLTKKAQTSFNRFIRKRDEALGCISCGIKTGQMHAGHYRTVGHGGNSLRFNELNCHKQCAQCNSFKSGNIREYRISLIKKIGVDEVDKLEAAVKPVKYSAEELKEIKATYDKKYKELCDD